MITLYKCEVCGHIRPDQAETKRCEERGVIDAPASKFSE